MSLILDALRKSEHERQRQAGPAMAEMPVIRPHQRQAPVLALAIGGLVAVNLAVLAWFMLRKPADSLAVQAPATAPATTAPAQAPATATTAAPATRDLQPLVEQATPAYDQPAPAQYQPPSAPDPALLPRAQAAIAAEQPPPPRAAPRPTAGQEAMVPTINDLTPQATAGLPQLNLDLHVYGTSPSDRFVFINNRRYLEGSTTPEGIRIERITPDGVVLGWRSLHFLLPRQ
jgi:general secretion pathway protein B